MEATNQRFELRTGGGKSPCSAEPVLWWRRLRFVVGGELRLTYPPVGIPVDRPVLLLHMPPSSLRWLVLQRWPVDRGEQASVRETTSCCGGLFGLLRPRTIWGAPPVFFARRITVPRQLPFSLLRYLRVRIVRDTQRRAGGSCSRY